MIITIDGPVTSGKSSIARHLAQKLNFYYINSGLLFRAFSYVLTERCLTPVERLVTITREQILGCMRFSDFYYRYENNQEHILYGSDNITWFLKNPEIDHAASLAGTNPEIRELILPIERRLAEHHDVVVDGRDTGSVVFPQADLKIYLTASLEVRAQRWQKDQQVKGNNVSLEEALIEVNRRDERDKTRLIAPLIQPEDAVVIDSSDKTVEQVVDEIIVLLKR